MTTSSLQPGPHVAGHTISHDDQAQILLIDHRLLVCTPLQYRLLTLLLSQAGHCVPYDQLIALLPPVSGKTMKTRLQHLISPLRAKLWPFGLDIACLNNMGYLLVTLPTEE
jgi:DNA-binding response OmpR family regulator